MAMVDDREQEQRRQLNKGFGASLNNAFEIAVVPVIFAGFGWLVDLVLHTSPVFAAIFGVLGLIGTFAKLYYGYSCTMSELEEAGPWRRASGNAPVSAEVSGPVSAQRTAS